MIGKSILALCALSLSADAAFADTPPRKSSRGDPNRMICKVDEEGASRLKRTRSCKTASEWAELRRQTKANIERIQNSRATNY